VPPRDLGAASGSAILSIEIQGLRLRIGAAEVLHDVRLSLRPGEIYGLIGPNGAGKSTTIAAALGLLKRESGTVAVFGRDPEREPEAVRADLGVLLEQNGLYGWMTAAGYLTFFARLHGRDMDLAAIGKRLDAVGLGARLRQGVGTFSHGMRQRLGLARALIGDPALLILDEPTNGLDPRGRREMHDVLLGLAADGAGVLLCTHLLDDVERLCDRVGIIVGGRTVAEGRIADLIRTQRHLPRFRLRLAGEPPPPTSPVGHVSIVSRDGDWWTVDLDAGTEAEAAWRELLFRGWPVTEIHRASGGLEELYLRLTARGSG
jgi:ABC-2 type transport system ATP-binding protein